MRGTARASSRIRISERARGPMDESHGSDVSRDWSPSGPRRPRSRNWRGGARLSPCPGSRGSDSNGEKTTIFSVTVVQQAAGADAGGSASATPRPRSGRCRTILWANATSTVPATVAMHEPGFIPLTGQITSRDCSFRRHRRNSVPRLPSPPRRSQHQVIYPGAWGRSPANR